MLEKLVAKYSDIIKVAFRNVRKNGIDKINRLKSNGISEDDLKVCSEEIQQLADITITKNEKLQKERQPEINNFFHMR